MWNCNGDLWTHPERLEEVMRDHDIILLTETHESRERGLPRIHGFHWESTHRKCTRQNTSRGSGGVAILFRHELQSRIQIVARDHEARFIWLRLELSHTQIIYIALCYFAPTGSRFALTEQQEEGGMGESPYTCLMEGIMEYSTLGEVFLMGDFNARTRGHQCESYDFEDPEILYTIDAADTRRISADTAVPTAYGHHLLRLGSQHRLVIYNGMAQWPASGSLTCMPHRVADGGGSIVDYIMGSREASRLLSSFTIPPIPIGADHTYLSLSFMGDPPLHTHHTHTPHHHPLHP